MIKFIAEMLREEEFVRRGNAFFRVYGDGVLQVLKYTKRVTPFYQEILHLGLFSMYGELMPQWFTSRGCIPLYNAKYLSEPLWSHRINQLYRKSANRNIHINADSNDMENIFVFHINIEELRSTLLPFLNRIQTQQDIILGIEELERCNCHTPPEESENKGIRWTDGNKYAPYLAIGDYCSAKRIMQTFFELYRNKEDERALSVKSLMELADSGDSSRIALFLKTNYVKNVELASFCMKSRK